MHLFTLRRILVNDEVTEKEEKFIDDAIFYGERLYPENFYRLISVEVQNYFINASKIRSKLIIITQAENGLIIKWLVLSQIYDRTVDREPLSVESISQIDFM